MEAPQLCSGTLSDDCIGSFFTIFHAFLIFKPRDSVPSTLQNSHLPKFIFVKETQNHSLDENT